MMKDVTNNDMLRGDVSIFDPEISEWGEPTSSNVLVSFSESIAELRVTW